MPKSMDWGGKSYLERLFRCKFYADGDENYVTKLVRNYRCHPAILQLPSDQFYNGELIPCRDDTSFLSFSTDIVPNQDFPVHFKHVLKLRNTLESLGLLDIKIGSVEQFQGQERFNVAITRAISLAIVIGNPHIICKDPYWNNFLWYCVDNNSYQGCPLPERTDNGFKEPSRAENSFSVDENDWGEEPHQPDTVAPGTNEDEWSDGWKCETWLSLPTVIFFQNHTA
ncbi:hypothetical protein MLD38_011992 [Melastoma candidum]|uniref:Uncharacterized protein n=1 Tax=Melastoma candidum TaxID=119954 RepID=A0ACB9R4W6_9MYRT|nr:hypothetical protein MLD38_011992 [Melastoma candidum]